MHELHFILMICLLTLENIAGVKNNLLKIHFELYLLVSFHVLMEPFPKKDLK